MTHPVHRFARRRAGVGRELVAGVVEIVEVEACGSPAVATVAGHFTARPKFRRRSIAPFSTGTRGRPARTGVLPDMRAQLVESMRNAGSATFRTPAADFGLLLHPTAPELCEPPPNAQHAARDVDVVASERDELTPPKAGTPRRGRGRGTSRASAPRARRPERRWPSSARLFGALRRP